MSDPHYIYSFCRIRNSQAFLNQQILPIGGVSTLNEFLKTIYQHLQLDYPKFFKMDELCKLSFIAAEMIWKDFPVKESKEGEVAIIFSNSSSTLETDRRHQESIQDKENYFPSPAVFVYTLPNIAIGEITIRHKLKGENSFFVTEHFDTAFISQYVNSLLKNNRAEMALTGWVNYEPDGYDCFVCLSGKEKKGPGLEYTKENLDILYKS
jgi:hypothetical protein